MRPAPRRIAVLGLGRTGDAVVRWALARRCAGEDVEVSAFVEHDTEALRVAAVELRALGAHVFLGVEDLPDDAYDVIVVSPGIAPHRPIVVSARRLGIPVISEIELAYRMAEVPFAAVTGTNGKTTTTALLTHILRAGGIDARAVGNIGAPAIAVVDEMGTDGILVAECSSFQLALTVDFHPRVAVLLNVTPDHVDWHGSLQNYAADKGRVFANLAPGDVAVIDIDDPGSAAFVPIAASSGASVIPVTHLGVPDGGAGLADGTLAVVRDGQTVLLADVADLLIRGEHNVGNALAGAAAGLALGVSVAVVASALRSFEPIEHRLEPAGVVDGVEFVNDSKATNPEAVLKALTAFGGRPVIVLLGGRDKGTDLAALVAACRERCRFAILFGEARERLRAAFDAGGAEYREAATMRDAVDLAMEEAARGDVVLLSPACSSYDEFADFEHRGRVFKEIVAGKADAR